MKYEKVCIYNTVHTKQIFCKYVIYIRNCCNIKLLLVYTRLKRNTSYSYNYSIIKKPFWFENNELNKFDSYQSMMDSLLSRMRRNASEVEHQIAVVKFE